LEQIVRSFNPEIVFHFAAQPLVLEGYASPHETFEVNVQGTVNLLESLKEAEALEVAIVATTDKVYLPNKSGVPHSETDPLGGLDPYSASKAAADLVVGFYRGWFLENRNVAVSAVRAGNVIGGGDWAKHRLVPDLVRSWKSGEVFGMRNPSQVRPWQHVLEPLRGYLVYAEFLHTTPAASGPMNFGPDLAGHLSVEQVVEQARNGLPGLLFVNSNEHANSKETESLRIDNSRAASLLGVQPIWNASKAVERSINWYRSYYDGADPWSLLRRDLHSYGVDAAVASNRLSS
jgi:CDP-glucose 4,6-dehydratase